MHVPTTKPPTEQPTMMAREEALEKDSGERAGETGGAGKGVGETGGAGKGEGEIGGAGEGEGETGGAGEGEGEGETGGAGKGVQVYMTHVVLVDVAVQLATSSCSMTIAVHVSGLRES